MGGLESCPWLIPPATGEPTEEDESHHGDNQPDPEAPHDRNNDPGDDDDSAERQSAGGSVSALRCSQPSSALLVIEFSFPLRGFLVVKCGSSPLPRHTFFKFVRFPRFLLSLRGMSLRVRRVPLGLGAVLFGKRFVLRGAPALRLGPALDFLGLRGMRICFLTVPGGFGSDSLTSLTPLLAAAS
jgi:hypothetical protein